ncbi:hypothetical protein BVX95_02225 [archaeon D22]|nr:hypothetical protein BVX95_02225 [archaeon D22]
MKKVALALGGGGAKFFAHLGMIEVLQENNIPIDYISGSSMGSIAGCLIANGVEIQDIKKVFYKKRYFLNWLTPSFRRFGFLSQKGISKRLEKLLPQRNIEKSKIGLSITSSNILDGNLHLFEKGDIITAVNASCAFPGVFPPVQFEGKMLVDGGVLNNIPADICRKKVGKNGIVISSTVDAKMHCKLEDIKSPFDIYQRIIYLPMYEKRAEVMNKNSDFVIEHFKEKTLSIKTGQDVFKVVNKKALEAFYELGRTATLRHIDEIKKLINS